MAVATILDLTCTPKKKEKDENKLGQILLIDSADTDGQTGRLNVFNIVLWLLIVIVGILVINYY